MGSICVYCNELRVPLVNRPDKMAHMYTRDMIQLILNAESGLACGSIVLAKCAQGLRKDLKHCRRNKEKAARK